MILMCLIPLLLTTDTQALNLDQTKAIMPQIQEEMGITEEIEVIPLSYEEVIAHNQDVWHTYGWVYINADYHKIYINQWLMDGLGCDYVWTIAHELTHVRQCELGTIDRVAYATTEKGMGYNALPNEQEADNNAYYYCMKYNKRS